MGNAFAYKARPQGSAAGRVPAPPSLSAKTQRHVHDVIHSPGKPLDSQTRAYMEPRFRYDFSRVPVHADSNATTLAINKPGDAFEQEADGVAERVMRTSEPAGPVGIENGPVLRRKCACGGTCSECEAERKGNLQRRAAHTGESATVPPIVHEVLRSPGQLLDAATRAYMEPRFGYDLSKVRVHADAKAAESARAVNALAYTVGSNIVFGAGRYTPKTAEGDELLAHELTHVVQQRTNAVPAAEHRDEAEANLRSHEIVSGARPSSIQASGIALRRQKNKCPHEFKRADNFAEMIALVREAETKLIACGYKDIDSRIHVIRGIYYGTKWSADFKQEGSTVRNLGFQVFTSSLEPEDPRSCLDCGLFDALRDSQDVKDSKRHVDFGHLIIGLDARRSSSARTASIPTQTGTGLAISTWLGDLGGGAAMLSAGRVSDPTKSALSVFRGSDFGGSINLEGDVAGYDVARDSSVSDEPSSPKIPAGKMIADALEDYLSPKAAGVEWNSRCTNFLQMNGGKIDKSGMLSNRASLINVFASQISDFACLYLVNRLQQKGTLRASFLREASKHIDGSSKEVAGIFVAALENCMKHPSNKLEASGTAPAVSAVGSASSVCEASIIAIEAKEKAEHAIEDVEKKGEKLLEGIKKLF